MEPGERAAWANRAASAALVAAYLAGAARAMPDAEARAALHYAVVTTAGWGHLLGAARLPARGALPLACWSLGLVNAFVLYGLAVASVPALLLPLLAVSVWHAVENDVALPAAYAGDHRLGPHPRRAVTLAVCGAVTAGVLALAAAALPPSALGALENAPFAAALHGALRNLGFARRLAFGDVFAAATLHHLVSTAGLLAARVRADRRSDPERGRRFALRIAASHAAPVVLLALLPLAGPEGTRLRAALLAPPLYLFCSVLHVAQTTWRRGVARP
jgi:hypothetical protein